MHTRATTNAVAEEPAATATATLPSQIFKRIWYVNARNEDGKRKRKKARRARVVELFIIASALFSAATVKLVQVNGLNERKNYRGRGRYSKWTYRNASEYIQILISHGKAARIRATRKRRRFVAWISNSFRNDLNNTFSCRWWGLNRSCRNWFKFTCASLLHKQN